MPGGPQSDLSERPIRGGASLHRRSRAVSPSKKARNLLGLATERSHRNRFSKTHQGVLRDPNRIDTEGVAGELAFAKAFDLPLDEVQSTRPTSFNFKLA